MGDPANGWPAQQASTTALFAISQPHCSAHSSTRSTRPHTHASMHSVAHSPSLAAPHTPMRRALADVSNRGAQQQQQQRQQMQTQTAAAADSPACRAVHHGKVNAADTAVSAPIPLHSTQLPPPAPVAAALSASPAQPAASSSASAAAADAPASPIRDLHICDRHCATERVAIAYPDKSSYQGYVHTHASMHAYERRSCWLHRALSSQSLIPMRPLCTRWPLLSLLQ